jgi:hypothetical protein
VQVGVGNDRVVGDPGIHDSLELVTHPEGITPSGDRPTNDELIEMGDDRPGGRNEREPSLLGRRHRRSGWLGSGLRRGFGDHLGGAEEADVDQSVNAALVQGNVCVEAGVSRRGSAGALAKGAAQLD